MGASSKVSTRGLKGCESIGVEARVEIGMREAKRSGLFIPQSHRAGIVAWEPFEGLRDWRESLSE